MLLFERSTKRVLGLKQLHKDTNKKPAETFDLSGRDYSFQTAFMEFSFSIHTAFQTASPLPSSLLARQLNGPYFFFFSLNITDKQERLCLVLVLVPQVVDKQVGIGVYQLLV